MHLKHLRIIKLFLSYVHKEKHRSFFFFFLNDTAPPEIYPLPLPDALPISPARATRGARARGRRVPAVRRRPRRAGRGVRAVRRTAGGLRGARRVPARAARGGGAVRSRCEIGRAHV